MTHLEERTNGYTIRFEGDIHLDEVRQLQLDLRNELAGASEPFVLVLDVRTLRHFHADAQAALEEMLENCPENGLHRISAIAVSTGFATLFCDMMVRAELMDLYQYMDISYEPDWRMELESFLALPE